MRVAIESTDAGLRQVLSRRLAAWPGLIVEEAWEADRGDVVVALAHEFSPRRCERRVSEGIGVVVLATVWRAVEERAYLAAGASAYVAMNLDLPPLARAIEAAAIPPETVCLGAGCEHRKPPSSK